MINKNIINQFDLMNMFLSLHNEANKTAAVEAICLYQSYSVKRNLYLYIFNNQYQLSI